MTGLGRVERAARSSRLIRIRTVVVPNNILSSRRQFLQSDESCRLPLIVEVAGDDAVDPTP